MEAINTAARWLQTGDAEVVVAGGVENMSMMPYYVRKARYGYRFGDAQLEDGTLDLITDPFENVAMGDAGRRARRRPVHHHLAEDLARHLQRRAPVERPRQDARALHASAAAAAGRVRVAPAPFSTVRR